MLLYNEVKYTEVCSIGRNMSEGLKFGMVDGRSLQYQRFVTIRRWYDYCYDVTMCQIKKKTLQGVLLSENNQQLVGVTKQSYFYHDKIDFFFPITAWRWVFYTVHIEYPNHSTDF